MTPLLSDLREPPVVGRYYLVPVVERYPWHGIVTDWPVLGPLHDDAEFFNFAEPHYHIDARFVGARLHRGMADRVPWTWSTGDPAADGAMAASGWPLHYRGVPLPKGRPALRRLRCKRSAAKTGILLINDGPREGMTKRYGNPAAPICLRDGRKLCPHRKVDLTSFAPDALGVVTCPLHGLRVRVVQELDDAHG